MNSPAYPRVLMVHAYYRHRGGEDLSFEIEADLLRHRGHEVVLHVASNGDFASRSRTRQAAATVWNRAASHEIGKVVENFRPDVVHFQNTFPALSPAVYRAAHKHSAVVETIRNFRPTCVNALLYRDGQVCERCVGSSVAWHGIRFACYRGSRSASAVVATMNAVHRLAGTWSTHVDRYVILNRQAQRTLAHVIPPSRMVYRPNTIWPEPEPGDGSGGFALFVGRLSPEKGVGTLLEAWRRRSDDLALVVVGDGVLTGLVAKAAESDPRIDFPGRMSSAEVIGLMQRASCLVFPSEWYEGFPRVILESLACGTPVAAARLGAAEELVEEEVSGRLFEPGNADALAATVSRLVEAPPSLRVSTRSAYDRAFSSDVGYQALVGVYRQAIDERWNGQPVRSQST